MEYWIEDLPDIAIVGANVKVVVATGGHKFAFKTSRENARMWSKALEVLLDHADITDDATDARPSAPIFNLRRRD